MKYILKNIQENDSEFESLIENEHGSLFKSMKAKTLSATSGFSQHKWLEMAIYKGIVDYNEVFSPAVRTEHFD